MTRTPARQQVARSSGFPMRQTALRLAIVSALGACGWMAVGMAHAAEQCDQSSSSDPYQAKYCYANDAGEAGSDITLSNSSNYTTDATQEIPFIGFSEPLLGIMTGMSTGADGDDSGAAGASGQISLTNSGALTLSGTTSPAAFNSVIFAKGLGGNGDTDNGDNDTSGGAGGTAQSVTIQNTGTLTVAGTVLTPSTGLFGIHALAQGGVGGNQNNGAEGDQTGGQGGNAGTISITNGGAINLGSSDARLKTNTSGAAISAQATGGQGGDDNGTAGTGGTINVDHSGLINSYWQVDQSAKVFGIRAETLGGDGTTSKDNSDSGGDGGGSTTSNWTQEIQMTVDGGVVLDVAGSDPDVQIEGAGVAARAVGGKGGTSPPKDKPGGTGGTAGDVTVQLTSRAYVTTHGDNLPAVAAQSVGGQGGDGQDSTALAGQGGGGGFGGGAGKVTVSADGAIVGTTGDFSIGYVAQSIGGGGGTGSDFVAVLGGQGGNGGNGGDAGMVDVTISGGISTTGQHAHAVLAQSIAGSGGAGGADTSDAVALGGDGAGGGTAGQVTLSTQATISTSGYDSHGIVGQSIGGGGGASGSATGLLSVGGNSAGATGSAGGGVTINNTGPISTTGNASIGVVAQSIGGGGGSGGDSLGVVGVGGDGASAGGGGAVLLQNLGVVQTYGQFSAGVLAQSIGGGGGSGGDTFTASVGVSVALGGSGSGGGDGGTVCIANRGNTCATDDAPTSQSTYVNTHGDYAPGIIAQSIGGGGGAGGSVKNVSLASVLALQVGGSAGQGGNSGSAEVNYSGLNLSTGGAHAPGILVQAIGGGGGNGGDSSYADATLGVNAALVMGGAGGAGGTGGAAIVSLSDSRIVTGTPTGTIGADPATYAPNDSFGILAQSIGGGGGNGGSATARDLVLAVPTGDGTSVALNLEATVGGAGGAGSNACASDDTACVTQIVLDSNSSVATLGDGSHALVAQSIGGGGGNGGDSSALAATLGDGDSVSATVGMALGGTGAGGGDGGKVSIALGDAGSSYAPLPPSLVVPPYTDIPPASSIITYGDQANGVLAQSIGGGGGNGGVGSTNAFSNGGMTNVDVTIGLGGTGGGGGKGGEVDITLNPNFVIRTLGSGSRGIVAQSIGGGGGASQGGTMGVSAGRDPEGNEGGGSGKLSLSLGATGGSGATGGTVNATLLGAIRTEGGDADGALLQSIGGGGGLGGSVGSDASGSPILERLSGTDDDAEADDENSSYNFGVAVGGKGGTGGDGGAVNATFAGQIGTTGDWADGLVAQSIGGGGGTGGSSTASGSQASANLTIGVGGTGGAAGQGGTVTAYFDGSHDNKISTAGYRAYGVLLQSIGGGGGQAGDGSAKSHGTLAVGGSGGASGAGGAIQTPSGEDGGWVTVATTGVDAVGIAMQSIGGGGGIGGAGSRESAADDDDDSHDLALAVGGSGGAAGNGGIVDVTFGTKVTTTGDRAYGLVAQSIGGGGGMAGAGDGGKLSSVAFGGSDGANGDGEKVSVSLNAGSSISTTGDGAHGIIAQSIGGGGGIAGDTRTGIDLDSYKDWQSSTADGNGGSTGDGGEVDVNVNGNVVTTGASAFGIIAQSIGGAGGLGGSSSSGYAGNSGGQGQAQDVTVTQTGQVIASGDGATGIFAQSQGSQGDGVVTVNVYGTVTGGSGDGHGVWFVGSNQNILNIGVDGLISSNSEIAIQYDGASLQINNNVPTMARADAPAGTLTINNAGVVLGNIKCHNDAGDVACDTRNETAGTLSDATLYQSNIDNAGRVVIGKPGAFGTLTVAGDFTLQSAGMLQADVDFERLKAPRMVVQGDARLDGRVDVRPLTLLPGREVTVATLEGDIQGVPRALDTPVIDYDARLQGQDVRVRAAGADFAASSMQLADNPRSVARHVQGAWDLGGNAAMAPLFAALDAASRSGADTYAEQLADLSPGVAVAPAAQMQASMARFTGAMMSCPAFQGGSALTGEQDCLWGQVSGLSTDQDGGGGVSGFSLDGVTYQFGGQRQVSPGWFLGGSVAYENTHLRGDDGRVSGKGDSGYAGVVLKREVGPWTFSAGLGGGYGQYDIDRSIRIPGLESTASSDPDIYGAALRLRIARTFASEKFYLKPYLDLDAMYTHMPRYSESGNAMHLDVESSNEFIMGLSPMLEVGGKVSLDNGAVMRPFAYGGVSFLSQDEYTAKARLQGAPDGAGAFETSLPVDDVIGRLGAGLQVSNAGGVDFRLQYDGEFSSHIQSHRASLKLMVPF